MNITKIELHNFRNYLNCKIDKFSRLNIIIGQNGVGKTSILESIYLGSLSKTFKSNDDTTMIKNGTDVLKIKIYYYDNVKNNILELVLSKNGKKTKINDYSLKKLSDFICQYKVIFLSPDELKIIKASPSVRRNYLNIQISQLNKEYITLLNSYNLLIKNKNDFLKKLLFNSNLDTKYLDIVDEKLVDLGLKIFNFRKDYIDKINENIDKYFKIFNENYNLSIKYISDFNINDKEKLVSILKKNRVKDINLGLSSLGIHRDDYDFIHNDLNSKEYSSQGIQKLIILSMKIAEIDVFTKYYNIEPILLLDDLFSELDNNNKNKIFKLLDKNLQVFITTTDIKNINKKIVDKAKIYDLDERKKYEK